MSEDIISVGEPGDSNFTGTVYLFTTDGEYIEKLVPPDGQPAYFGFDVSIFERTLVVGAPTNFTSAGSVYLYSI